MVLNTHHYCAHRELFLNSLIPAWAGHRQPRRKAHIEPTAPKLGCVSSESSAFPSHPGRHARPRLWTLYASRPAPLTWFPSCAYWHRDEAQGPGEQATGKARLQGTLRRILPSSTHGRSARPPSRACIAGWNAASRNYKRP